MTEECASTWQLLIRRWQHPAPQVTIGCLGAVDLDIQAALAEGRELTGIERDTGTYRAVAGDKRSDDGAAHDGQRAHGKVDLGQFAQKPLIGALQGQHIALQQGMHLAASGGVGARSHQARPRRQPEVKTGAGLLSLSGDGDKRGRQERREKTGEMIFGQPASPFFPDLRVRSLLAPSSDRKERKVKAVSWNNPAEIRIKWRNKIALNRLSGHSQMPSCDQTSSIWKGPHVPRSSGPDMTNLVSPDASNPLLGRGKAPAGGPLAWWTRSFSRVRQITELFQLADVAIGGAPNPGTSRCTTTNSIGG